MDTHLPDEVYFIDTLLFGQKSGNIWAKQPYKNKKCLENPVIHSALYPQNIFFSKENNSTDYILANSTNIGWHVDESSIGNLLTIIYHNLIQNDKFLDFKLSVNV